MNVITSMEPRVSMIMRQPIHCVMNHQDIKKTELFLFSFDYHQNLVKDNYF